MRKSKTIKIDDREITVKEITALESQQYIENIGNDEGSFIDELFPDRIPASLTKLCTGLAEEDLLAFTESENLKIIEAVEEVNPRTASRIKKLADVGRKALELDPDLMLKLQELNSKKTAADS